jgi:hypothetical protein
MDVDGVAIFSIHRKFYLANISTHLPNDTVVKQRRIEHSGNLDGKGIVNYTVVLLRQNSKHNWRV